MAVYFGYNPPFVGGAGGVMSRQEDLRLVKNDLLQLILTSPGERVHRPDFGTDLRASVFDPSDTQSYELLAADIRDEILRSEPRVLNPRVSAQPVGDGQIVKVFVIANLTFNPDAVLELEQEILV